MTMRIYVGNLSYQMSESDLRDIFTPFGEVNDATIITDRGTGRSKGFGFVEMRSGDEAEQAIKELNGKEVLDRVIVVNEARPRQERDRSGGREGSRGGGRRRF